MLLHHLLVLLDAQLVGDAGHGRAAHAPRDPSALASRPRGLRDLVYHHYATVLRIVVFDSNLAATVRSIGGAMLQMLLGNRILWLDLLECLQEIVEL